MSALTKFGFQAGTDQNRRHRMNESALRRALLAIAVLGLAVGIGVWQTGFGAIQAGSIWTVATLPVVVALAISILHDFWIGRFGVDAIALVPSSQMRSLPRKSRRSRPRKPWHQR
jgi:hypothetical protein